MKEDTKAMCLECGTTFEKWISNSKECPECEGEIAFFGSLDTNTLREELKKIIIAPFNTPDEKVSDICFFIDNKFNQKLEEIEEALENHAKQNTYEDEEALVYKTTMNEVLQIIKNKKN